MPSFTAFRRHCCFSSFQVADKHFERAQEFISTRKHEDVEAALVLLESTLKFCPQWEKALELKAKALLYLKRFKDVAEMLHEYIPSLTSPRATTESPLPRERTRLLSDYVPEEDFLKLPVLKFMCVGRLKEKLSPRLSKKLEKEQWRCLVLGQACFHLGMLEDAMILLESGKRTASAASRRQSNGMRDDNFCYAETATESDLVNQLLGNIKFLLRRRSAALSAMEAGLYSESVRHYSKIVDGRKGTPQGFIAECYLHRAIAYQALGRVADAIADCNRTLALNPSCARAISARASLYEMVKCFSECLSDLQQLKMIYEAALRYQMLPEPRWTIRKHTSDIDFAGGLEYINSKIMSTRQRLTGVGSIDAHAILDLPRNCEIGDVERAFLLISLKHRSDKAAHFVDRCEYVDERDVETVKDEARASALRLSQLIQKAYTRVLSSIVDEETESRNDLQIERAQESMHTHPSNDETQRRDLAVSLLQQEEWHRPSSSERNFDDDEVGTKNMDVQQLYSFKWEGEEVEGQKAAERSASSEDEEVTITASEQCGSWNNQATETVVLEAFKGFHIFSGEEEQESNVFSREDVGAIISHALCHDELISAHHQPLCPDAASAWMTSFVSSHPLPVT